jgi:hypothetical protein
VTEHFEFNAGRHSTIDTERSQESATVYSADGIAIGTIRLDNIFHLRDGDTNGNGTPDPGEITAWIERGHVSCP